MRAIRFEKHGGPEVLRVEEMPTPAPGPGQILVRVGAAGINFIDIYHRTGLYSYPLPNGLGQDGAGTVEKVGEGVSDFAAGDRVAFMVSLSSYAEYAIVAVDRAVKIPAGVADDIAAAAMLKGLTARYLLKATYPVRPGQTILLHAAAGGVGQIVAQWASYMGVRVIGIVGSEDKVGIAKDCGCSDVIVSPRGAGFAEKVRALTNGEGVPVVYDSVGKDTTMESLDCLAPLGMLVSFGNASGPAPAIEPGLLAKKGSLFITRPTLVTYIRTPALFRETAEDLFDVLAAGHVKIAPPRRYNLEDAGQAHADLEGRKTTGSLVLIP